MDSSASTLLPADPSCTSPRTSCYSSQQVRLPADSSDDTGSQQAISDAHEDDAIADGGHGVDREQPSQVGSLHVHLYDNAETSHVTHLFWYDHA